MALFLVSVRFFRLYSAFVYGNVDEAIEKPISCLLSCIAYETHAHIHMYKHQSKKSARTHTRDICYGRKSKMTTKRTISEKRTEKENEVKRIAYVYTFPICLILAALTNSKYNNNISTNSKNYLYETED